MHIGLKSPKRHLATGEKKVNRRNLGHVNRKFDYLLIRGKSNATAKAWGSSPSPNFLQMLESKCSGWAVQSHLLSKFTGCFASHILVCKCRSQPYICCALQQFILKWWVRLLFKETGGFENGQLGERLGWEFGHIDVVLGNR